MSSALGRSRAGATVLGPGDPDPSGHSDHPSDPRAPTTPTASQSPTGQPRLHSRLSKSYQHARNSQRSPSSRTQQDSSGTISHSRKRLSNNGVDKPLPPAPDVTTPPSPLNTLTSPKSPNTPITTTTSPKLTLRSRFNTGPVPTSGSIPHAERPRIKIPASQHVASEVSPTALSPSFPREKSSPYHATTGDRWPILDAALDITPSRSAQPGPSSARAQDSAVHASTDSAQHGEQRSSDEHAQEGPSDYELFIRRAQEQDRHYREQLLRFIPGRSKDNTQKAKKHSSAPRGFSWQRTAAKRQQQEQDVRRSWQAGEQARPNPATAAWRNSDAGLVTSGALRRKGSRSSLSSIKQAIAHYIKPPRPPSAQDD